MNKKFLYSLSLISFSLIMSCSSSNQIQPVSSDSATVSSKNIAKKDITFRSSKKVIKSFSDSSALNPSTKKVVDLLKSASKEITLISESDQTFDISVWSNQANLKLDAKKLLEMLKLNPKLKAEMQSESSTDLLKPYTETSYWTNGGYSDQEAKKFTQNYLNFSKLLSDNLKGAKIFYTDDPENLKQDPQNYDPSKDFSGEVGVYIIGKFGNDLIVLHSSYVWT